MGNALQKRNHVPLLILVCTSFGLGLFLSAMWTARADASGVSTAVVYTTRFISFGTYMLVAWMFRNHMPSVEHITLTGLLCMAAHLILACLTHIIPVSDIAGNMLAFISGGFEGVANALITLLFAHVFSTFSPSRSAIGIGLAYLFVDCGILVLDLLEAQQLFIARTCFIVASLVILFICVRMLLRGSITGVRELQYGMAREGGETQNPLLFLTVQSDWFLLLIVAVLFPSLFGLIAQVSSATGGNFALYDITTEIVVIAVEVAFLAYLTFFGSKFKFASILGFIVPLYATGFALFPANWDSQNPLAGCFIRIGYVLLSILIWVIMARKAYEDPRHTYLYFAIYCGVSNAQLGRLIGSFAMGDAGPSSALCETISLAALWAICIFGLAIFFLLRREAPEQANALQAQHQIQSSFETPASDLPSSLGSSETALLSEQNQSGSAPAQSGGDSALLPASQESQSLQAVDTFSAQLEHLADRIQLTSREREVLVEAMHGYSRTNIASKLFLSPETVKTYMNRAYNKAGVSSKQEFIALVEHETL